MCHTIFIKKNVLIKFEIFSRNVKKSSFDMELNRIKRIIFIKKVSSTPHTTCPIPPKNNYFMINDETWSMGSLKKSIDYIKSCIMSKNKREVESFPQPKSYS